MEYTIHAVVEKHVDLSVCDARYHNDESGATAIHPKILLKIILLAYARGMLSSRQMERACLENVTFMALACGYTPDHSTIAAFVSSMQEEVKSVFCNVLLVCDQLGLLGGSHFSLDGVKLAANVSKAWSGAFDELKHKRDTLQEKWQQAMDEPAHTDDQSLELDAERRKEREQRLKRQVERLNACCENEKPQPSSDSRDIQSNVVDNEPVKMLTAHSVIQGYNAQALVDPKHQVILVAEAVSAQDHENLQPMLQAAHENLGKGEDFFKGKQLTADSNYHSFDSLTFCESARVDAYIPDIQFRKRDERFANQERFKDGKQQEKEVVLGGGFQA